LRSALFVRALARLSTPNLGNSGYPLVPGIIVPMTNHRKTWGILVAICCLTLLLGSCGGSGCGSTSAPPPSFALTASPSSVLVSQSSTSVPIELSAQASNGFQGTVSVSLQGLPTGITTSRCDTIVTSSFGCLIMRGPRLFSPACGAINAAFPWEDGSPALV
jgi:hypothetical protein